MSGPQIGDYGVCATSNTLMERLLGWVIRWDTQSPVNHAFVYVGDGQIVEAKLQGARVAAATEYPNVIWSTGRLPAELTPDPRQREAIALAARSLVGRDYNVLDLVAIGLAQRRMGSLVTNHTWWARRLSDDGHLICSQLVDLAYQRGGISLFTDGRLPGLVSPGDLYNLLRPATAPASESDRTDQVSP